MTTGREQLQTQPPEGVAAVRRAQRDPALPR